jgi:hypothetical protein
MIAPDDLWPARPEYVRRGTPLRWLTGDGEYGRPGDLHLYCEKRGVPGDAVMRLCALDLRDVTARAHAAWAYTRATTRGLELHFNGKMYLWAGELSSLPGDAVAMYEILCCMACGGESVTVDEARVALAWAERVAGVAS